MLQATEELTGWDLILKAVFYIFMDKTSKKMISEHNRVCSENMIKINVIKRSIFKVFLMQLKCIHIYKYV